MNFPEPSTVAPRRRLPSGTALCLGVNLAGFAALVALVAARTSFLWRDEGWYLESVEALGRLGLTRSFLRGLPGPAGPLYACVHYVLSPLTGLRPLPVRLANIGLFGGLVAAQAMALRARRVGFPAARATYLLSAPMMFGVVGTALTEMPSMLAFGLQVALFLMAWERLDRDRPAALGLAAAAGLCCGLAIAGRQTFLISLVALPVLAWRRPSSWPILLALAASAAILPAFLVAAWGGLVPPQTAWVQDGFSFASLALSISYAGLVYCIYDTTWIRDRWRLFLGVVALGLVGNAALGLVDHMPLQQTVYHNLPAWTHRPYGLLASGLMLGFGLAFVARLARLVLDRDPIRSYFGAASLLMLTTPAKILNIFAGRYVLVALPLLLIVACEDAKDTPSKAARMALGCALGLISLNTYLTTN